MGEKGRWVIRHVTRDASIHDSWIREGIIGRKNCDWYSFQKRLETNGTLSTDHGSTNKNRYRKDPFSPIKQFETNRNRKTGQRGMKDKAWIYWEIFNANRANEANAIK